MRKRELLFGFGTGILVAGADLGLIQPDRTPTAAAKLTHEEIREAAEAMEMVVLSKQEYAELQEKKVDVEPAPTPPRTPDAPAVSAVQTPQVVPAQPPEVSAPATPPPAATPPASARDDLPAPEAAAPTNPPAPAQPPAVTTTKVFTVPYKATAEGVARTLVEAGILPKDNTLVDVLRAQNKLNRIRVGTYEVTVPATEEEIVQVITTPPKN